MAKIKIIISSFIIVLLIVAAGYLYAQNKAEKSAAENTTKTEEVNNKKTTEEIIDSTNEKEEVKPIEVYTIGQPLYINDGETNKSVKYNVIEANKVESLEKQALILVGEEDFYKDSTIYKKALNEGKTVLVYSKELDTAKVVEKFGVDDEVVGMDSTNGTYYQGYGYANIKGEIMPMLIAASVDVEDVKRSSVEELLRQVVKQNEAE